MATTKKTAVRPHARKKTDKKPRLNAAEKAVALDRIIKKESAIVKTKQDIKTETIAARPKISNVLVLSRGAVLLLWQRRWVFLAIAAIYGFLNVLLVRGFSSSSDIASLKQLVSGQYHGGVGRLIGGFAIFGFLVATPGGSSSDGSSSGGIYQFILILITSLAVVWALRQVMAGHSFRVRDSFYRGMYPLVPVLLIILLMLVELVPAVVGLTIFSEVTASGIAATWWQEVLWGIGCLALVLLSLYWLVNAVIAAYIATVPDMSPLSALRSARRLVRYRRWRIMSKLLFLPLAILLVMALAAVPVAFIWDPAAPWMVYILSALALVVMHAYIYTLYRELIA